MILNSIVETLTQKDVIIGASVVLGIFVVLCAITFIAYFHRKRKTIQYRYLNKYKKLYKLKPFEVIDNRRVLYVSERGVNLSIDTTSREALLPKTMKIYQYEKKKNWNKKYGVSITLCWIFMIFSIAIFVFSAIVFSIFQFNSEILSGVTGIWLSLLRFFSKPVATVASFACSVYFFIALILSYKNRKIYRIYIDSYLNFANNELANEFYKPVLIRVKWNDNKTT